MNVDGVLDMVARVGLMGQQRHNGARLDGQVRIQVYAERKLPRYQKANLDATQLIDQARHGYELGAQESFALGIVVTGVNGNLQ